MSLEQFGATSWPALRPIHRNDSGTVACPVSGNPVDWTEGEISIPVVHLVRDDLQRALESAGVQELRSRGYESRQNDILMPKTVSGREAHGYSSQYVGVLADLGESVAWVPVRTDDLPDGLEDGALERAHESAQDAREADESQARAEPSTRVGHTKHDDTDVYVGRQGDADLLSAEIGDPGWLGNPYPADEYGREEAVAMFTDAFLVQLENRPALRKAVHELQGQVLGCWCQRLEDQAPLCHAEVIAEAADRLIVPKGGDR